MKKNTRHNKIIIGISIAVGFAISIALLLDFFDVFIDPLVFTEETGIELPPSYKLIESGSNLGSFYFKFSLDDTDIQKLLADSSPWDQEWKRGPLHGQIGIHLSLGGSRVSYGGDERQDENDYFGGTFYGDASLVELFSSTDIYFVGNERCCGRNNLGWRDGEVIIIDPNSNTMWFSKWDDT